jgi:polyhydroxybutyrate depolymerase
MVFHGVNDTTVKLADGQASIDHWAWANGCKGSPAPTSPSPCVAYQACARPVVWCKLPGEGHKIWAQGANATWDFFSKF